MKLLKKICTTAIVMTLCAATPAIAQEWKNDLRTQFLNNKIYKNIKLLYPNNRGVII